MRGTLAGAVHVVHELLITRRPIGTGRGIAGIVLVTRRTEIRAPGLLGDKDISQKPRSAGAIHVPASAAANGT